MYLITRRLSPALALLAALLLGGCAGAPPDRAALHRVSHLVLVWLKQPHDSRSRQAVIDSAYGLRAIPGVLSVAVDRPLASTRPMVDDSFDLAIRFVLSDPDALEHYLSHPLHQRAAREVLAPNAARVLIYDSQPLR